MAGRGKWLASAMATVALTGSPALARAGGDDGIAALVAETSSERAIALADQQTAAGDLLGAAATLERALLADANDHAARLRYAATLCRLGDPQGARVEAGKLDRQKISDADWEAANRACGNALERPAPPSGGESSGLSGEAYVGIAYDSDAFGALTLQFLFGDEPPQRDDGFSAIGGLRLNFRSAGYRSGGGLYGSVNAIAKHDISGPDLDYTIGEGRLGYGGVGRNLTFGIGGVVRHVRLLGDPYVTELGGQGELLFGTSAPRRLRLRAEAVHQNYRDGFPGDQADGMRYDLSAAVESRVGRRGIFALGLAGELKSADERIFGYRGGRVFAVTELPAFGDGDYINLSGTLRYIDFRKDPPTPDRSETRIFARAAYGLPLVRRLYLEGAGSYTRRSANFSETAPFTFVVDPATYRSFGAEARLLFRF